MIAGQGTERWLPVVGYETRYEVSDRGRVRSISHGVMRQYMHGRRDGTRYPVVQFRNRSDRKKRYFRVHVLMLEAFVGPRPAGYVACHANDEPADNRLENLRWDTPSANMQDKVANGRHHNARKTHCKQGHEYTPENTYFYLDRRNCRACQVERQHKYVASLVDAGRP